MYYDWSIDHNYHRATPGFPPASLMDLSLILLLLLNRLQKVTQ